ncbi:MAG: hypothetical protein HY682_04020 [Chloroflexi bacterium]|nr:hypothetical protein [Chloroflexota bacterium]
MATGAPAATLTATPFQSPIPCIAPLASPTATVVPKSETAWTVYDPDPEHLWNRLFRTLFRRVTADGKEYGNDTLDPLLWRDTSHLLSGPSHSEAMAPLDEFLSTSGEQQVRDPVRRAMLQRDLWAVFDWLTVRSDTYPEQRQALKSRLASAIRAVALTRDEINSLPDNYQAAVTSGRYPSSHSGCYLGPPFLPPGLPDASGGWVGLGRQGGPIAISHVQDAHFLGRSAFLTYVRVPGGRDATLRFVEQMTARTADAVPVGTEVALVRRMLLVDDTAEIVATPIVEEVEIRRFNFSLPGSQDFYNFTRDRNTLVAGVGGGLHLVDREFLLFSSHEVDVFDIGPDAGRHQATVPASCQACHAHPSLANSAVQSILSYSRALFPAQDGQPTVVEVSSLEAETQAVIEWKVRQSSWKELWSLWNR